jgi:hypothetical protein
MMLFVVYTVDGWLFVAKGRFAFSKASVRARIAKLRNIFTLFLTALYDIPGDFQAFHLAIFTIFVSA